MKTKDIKVRIKEHFFMFPNEKLRVREIERVLGIPLPSVIRYCKELEKEGVLKTTRMRKLKFYTADKTNQNYLLEKRLFNIKKVYESGLIDYLRKTLHNPTIVLFGSYVNGEDTEESDIDLYIGSPSNREIDLRIFEKRLKRSVQLFRYKNIHKVSNPHLANNIINGITLNNYMEVFK